MFNSEAVPDGYRAHARLDDQHWALTLEGYNAPEVRIRFWEKSMRTREREFVGRIAHSSMNALTPITGRQFAAALQWAADYVDAERERFENENA